MCRFYLPHAMECALFATVECAVCVAKVIDGKLGVSEQLP